MLPKFLYSDAAKLYRDSLALTAKLYLRSSVYFFIFFLLASLAYHYLDPIQTLAVVFHPLISLSSYFLLSYFFYLLFSFKSSNLLYGRRYESNKEKIHYLLKTIYYTLLGTTFFVIPALAANGLTITANVMSMNSPFLALAFYFLAAIGLIWSLFYLPFLMIFPSAYLSEPTLDLSNLLAYVKQLLYCNWWRTIALSLGFYLFVFCLFDLLHYFVFYQLNREDAFTYLLLNALVTVSILPFISAYYTTLVEKLRERNLPDPHPAFSR